MNQVKLNRFTFDELILLPAINRAFLLYGYMIIPDKGGYSWENIVKGTKSTIPYYHFSACVEAVKELILRDEVVHDV